MRSKKILLVGDSRIRHLDTILNSMDVNFAFISKCFPGTTISRIVKKTVEILNENNTFSLIIIFGGINDITRIANRPLWIIKPRFDTVNDTVSYVKHHFIEGMDTLRLATQIPVVLCPTIGMDLSTYSPNNTDARDQQHIIEQSIQIINRFIYSVNSENHAPTPLIESTIHKCKGRSRALINYYAKLEDGCHPSPATRSQWASIIFRATSKFLEL